MNLTPEQVKPFETWANDKGYDIAHTYDTERSRWVFLNPMTADLFEAWQAALLRSAGDVWQHIATAPKDGTAVLLRDRSGNHADGYWLQAAYNGNGAWIWPFIHANPNLWQPLPAAPSSAGGGK